VRFRFLAAWFLASCAIAVGCAVAPERSFYDDLEGGEAGEGVDASGGGRDVLTSPVDATTGEDQATGTPESGPDAGSEVAAEAESADAGPDRSEPAEAAADAAKDADAGPGAPADAGVDAAPEAGCGPTDTTSNCGSCGAACGGLHAQAGGTACVSSVCQYTCETGYANCAISGANTTGCECHTPDCCGSSCQTAHEVGLLGEQYYDCNPLATASTPQSTLLDQALAACAAFTGNAAGCVGDLTCTNPNFGPWVCNGGGSTAGCNYCWSYGGVDVLKAENCTCPPPRGSNLDAGFDSGFDIFGSWN
jgi:hypothetical protein